MEDDPILLGLTALSLVAIPFLSYLLGRKQPKRLFVLPIISMVIGFILFLFLVIVQTTPLGMYLFYAAMSLWTGGLFGIFISWYFYSKRKVK